MQVLVVDDEPVLRELLSIALAEDGHDTLEAANGQEAWRMLKESEVQLVITDWMMPLLDGTELIRRIREERFQRYIYVILLTARSEQRDVVKGLVLGADDYLKKPFDVDELQARVGIGVRVLELENRLRRALKRLNHLATWDSVTGLLNRQAIMRHAKVELNRTRRTQQPMSVIMLDIDFFKRVNDQHGHLVGDQVLRSVAKLLPRTMRPYDLVGRWGGEEFLLILPNTNRTQAGEVAERIRTSVADAAIPFEGGTIRITVSLGAAEADLNNATSLDMLLGQADEALYSAKNQGRNRVCVV